MIGLVYVWMLVVVAMSALTIDLGFLYVAHAQAQGAADAAALAGGSAFIDYMPADSAVAPALARAYRFAAVNAFDSASVAVAVDTATHTVSVRAGRAVEMIFAWIFGKPSAEVSAMAVAQADSVVRLIR